MLLALGWIGVGFALGALHRRHARHFDLAFACYGAMAAIGFAFLLNAVGLPTVAGFVFVGAGLFPLAAFVWLRRKARRAPSE